MFGRKPDPPANAPAPRLTGRQRREQREMKRREKLMQTHRPGFRERYLSGCLAFLIVGSVVFTIALIVSLVKVWFFD